MWFPHELLKILIWIFSHQCLHVHTCVHMHMHFLSEGCLIELTQKWVVHIRSPHGRVGGRWGSLWRQTMPKTLELGKVPSSHNAPVLPCLKWLHTSPVLLTSCPPLPCPLPGIYINMQGSDSSASGGLGVWNCSLLSLMWCLVMFKLVEDTLWHWISSFNPLGLSGFICKMRPHHLFQHVPKSLKIKNNFQKRQVKWCKGRSCPRGWRLAWRQRLRREQWHQPTSWTGLSEAR